jgi:2-succinyl-6-hydroxy-2,4-cyclohexadiene-1-carboxylate synthase
MPKFGPPGEQIGYVVYEGGPDARPLVLLHGFTASSASFLTNIDGLRRYFTVVTADLLGHGDSDSPRLTEPYRPRHAVARIAGLCRTLGFERVLLCGHSLGGALALRIALDVPQSLVGLVMINSLSAVATSEWRAKAQRNLSAMAARLRGQGVHSLADSRVYPARSRRLPPAARDALARDFARLTGDGVGGTAEGLVAEVNAAERLAELRVPMLITFGDREEQFVAALPSFRSRLPPGVELVALPGAGHAANLEQPAMFEAAVVAFAGRLGWLAPAH